MIMAVSVSGVVLSSLCFEHSNSRVDQEGFLLGRAVSHFTDTISDSQLNNVKEEVIIYVYNYISCEGLFNWYDSSGKANVEKLSALLKNNKHKEVVGWYKFRRNSTLCVSLRERAIHSDLYNRFPCVQGQNFLYALFSSSMTSNTSTHSFDHTFFTFNGRHFLPKPVTVVNLKDTSHGEYLRHSNNTVNPTKGMYTQTLNRFMPEFLGEGGVLFQVITTRTLHSHLHAQMQTLCSSVSRSEDQIGKLVADIEYLRERVRIKEQASEPILSTPTSKSPLLDSDNNEMETLSGCAMETNHVPSNDASASHVIEKDKKTCPVNQESQATSVASKQHSEPRIHEDLKNLIIDGQLEMACSSSQQDSQEVKPIDHEEDIAAVPCLVPEPISQTDVPNKPTSLVLNGDGDNKDMVESVKEKNESESSEKKEKGDAFDFVTDLMCKAKSPTSTEPPKPIGSSSPTISQNKERKGAKIIKPNASLGSPRLSTARSSRLAKSKSVVVDNAPAKTKSGPITKDDLAITSKQSITTTDKNPPKMSSDYRSITSQRAARPTTKATGRPRSTSRSGSGPRMQDRSNPGQRGVGQRVTSGQRSGTSPKGQHTTEKKAITKVKDLNLSSSQPI